MDQQRINEIIENRRKYPTKAAYNSVGESLYSQAGITGNYREDTTISLPDLHGYLCRCTDKEAARLAYYELILPAIEAEGFTRAQAEVISGEAWQRGHSAGLSEVALIAMDVCEFAKNFREASGY